MRNQIRRNQFLAGCVPYSEEACSDAADSLGLLKGGEGFNFVGNFPTKGCYAYQIGAHANMAYYGTGGLDNQRREELTSPKYRPVGHDCSTKGNIYW